MLEYGKQVLQLGFSQVLHYLFRPLLSCDLSAVISASDNSPSTISRLVRSIWKPKSNGTTRRDVYTATFTLGVAYTPLFIVDETTGDALSMRDFEHAPETVDSPLLGVSHTAATWTHDQPDVATISPASAQVLNLATMSAQAGFLACLVHIRSFL